MPSKYLFLSNTDQSNSGGKVVWNNLPTLSESTRECYVSISNMDIEFSSQISTTPDTIFIKVNLPSMNYYSSNNDLPVLRHLTTDNFVGYQPSLDPSVELLTNDNLKKIEIQIVDGVDELVTDAIVSVNLMLKIDYVDQKAIAQEYLSQIPMRL